jgi:hypothetical protein
MSRVPPFWGYLVAPKVIALVNARPNAHHNYILPLVDSFVETHLLNWGILIGTGHLG